MQPAEVHEWLSLHMDMIDHAMIAHPLKSNGALGAIEKSRAGLPLAWGTSIAGVL